MFARPTSNRFVENEDGAILVFWAVALVVFLGLLGLSFDFGRVATTQSELQSYADSVSLAAAAELDGAPDSIARATRAAADLIEDSQTYGDGAKVLGGSNSYTLTFFKHDATSGGFVRAPENVTTSPAQARFVQVLMGDTDVITPLSGAAASLSGRSADRFGVMASAVAEFSLEACDVAPVAMCLPSTNFSAASSIGTSLVLNPNVGVGTTLPGGIRAVDTIASQLDGLSICAGLSGAGLEACLLAAQKPASACSGSRGLEISADVDATGLTDAINTRFGEFNGLVSGLSGIDAFSAGPNVLAGQTDIAGLCLPLDILPSNDDLSLPADDCVASGSCGVQGNGNFSLGRQAYVDAHYGGTDPFPDATTRFDFFRAEVEADADGSLLGGIVGGLAGGLLGGSGFVPQMCNPFSSQDPERRLMVVAGIDCSNGGLGSAGGSAPVREYFEVFLLGPAETGGFNVEITACLGGECGGGTLDTDVRDVVRLVE